MEENSIYDLVIKKLNNDNWKIIQTPDDLNNLYQIISAKKADKIIHIEIGELGFIKQFYQIYYHQYGLGEYSIHLATTKYFYDKMHNPLMKNHIRESYDKIIIINENSEIEKWID